jgi:hypothetical protein
MRKRTLIAAPALPAAAPAISHSSVKPKRNTTKAEDWAKQKEMHDELLKQVIIEAKAFSRPDSQEHGEK